MIVVRNGRRSLRQAIAPPHHPGRKANIKKVPPINAAAMSSTTQSHYESHSADSYESAYFYEVGAYTKHLSDLCRSRLKLESLSESTPTTTTISNYHQQQRFLLDIGGGTGSFTKSLIQSTDCRAAVIDPYLEQQQPSILETREDNNNSSIEFVAAPAESFMNEPMPEEMDWRTGYHQILLKEVAHHFSEKDRIPIFHGLWNGLVPTNEGSFPSFLMITRPHLDIDYPLWDAAKEVWARNQPSLQQFTSELTAAGFTDIHHTIETYPCSIPLKRWQSMVKARFWSTFADFSDAELDEACAEIAANASQGDEWDGNLNFEDRLLFITANKFFLSDS